ncbi:MAG TPA: hypothetical protein VFA11_00075 [Acidimicrobiales bacterium]|nr:hypothetical protein [Acidimicrobiales bacterium]
MRVIQTFRNRSSTIPTSASTPWGYFESIMVAGDVPEGEWGDWRKRWKKSRDPEQLAAEVAKAHPESADDIAQHVWDIWAIQLPEQPG